MARAEDALTDFDDLAIRRWGSRDALRRVVLAEALDAALVTRDVRLAESSGHLVRIEVC